MPRFDPETIAALAEGRLSPDEAARVEAAISNDPAALAELEMQRAAIEALGAAPELHLTELERSGLHASVADALGLVAVSAAPVEQEPRRVPWAPLGIAAAALVGLIAVVPVVGLLNTGGDDAGEIAFAPTATTTSDLQADTAAAEGDDGLDDPAAAITEDGAFDASEEAPGEELLGFGTTTAPARATTTTDDSVVEETTTTTETTTAAESTSSTVTTEGEATGEFDRVVADLTALRDVPDEVAARATEALEADPCWTEDTEFRGGEDPGDRWSFEYTEGEQAVVVFFRYDTEGALGPFAVYDSLECAAVAQIPESP